MTQGARAPLFDRLAERGAVASGDPPRALRILDKAGLRESIRRELLRLLNTRRQVFPSRALAGEEPTVIEYGLPDYSAMYTENPEDQKKLSGLVRGTIETFEPRLRDPKVEVRVLGGSEKALLVLVSGAVLLGRETERMSFAINVGGGNEKEAKLGG